ncbi:protein sym-1-like [Cimex lectularius]|uniref:Mitochondrial inner membrane protein Mpv17 n=1 Tax=Cimex lectularius TaxID=79782 RepID=A0A8I6S6X2_CIMLE|nr:protein sym-1-like [Cimex lectularius]
MRPARVLAAYQALLYKRPYITNSATTAVLAAAGDGIAQVVFERKKYDGARTMRMFIFGAMIGPVVTKWYRYLDSVVGHELTAKRLAVKLATDQILFAPACQSLSISFVALLEGKRVVEEVRTNFKDVLLASYKIWPFVQVLNFSLVPLQYRTLFVQVVALGWNTYFTWKLHKDNADIKH